VAAQDAEILPIRRPVKRKDLLGIEVCNLPPRTAVKGLTNENDDLLDGSRHGTSRQIAVSEWIASVPDHPGRTSGLVPRDAPRDRARPTLPAQQKITPTPRARLEQIVEELKTLTHPLQS
jgi:hypothetical protein